MDNETKEIFHSCFWWATFIGIVTLVIRPFISIKQSIRDTAITFLVSMLSGLLTEYVDIPDPVKFGLSGVCGLFAVRLYIVIEKILIKAEEDPLGFIKDIKDEKHDR